MYIINDTSSLIFSFDDVQSLTASNGVVDDVSDDADNVHVIERIGICESPTVKNNINAKAAITNKTHMKQHMKLLNLSQHVESGSLSYKPVVIGKISNIYITLAMNIMYQNNCMFIPPPNERLFDTSNGTISTCAHDKVRPRTTITFVIMPINVPLSSG
jgi:hypothetical protein